MHNIAKVFESLAIRLLWMYRATSLRRMPGLCPPQCNEMHTYKWPCRARIQRAWYKSYTQYSHWDDEIVARPIGRIVKIEQDSDGVNTTIEPYLDGPYDWLAAGYTVNPMDLDDPEPHLGDGPDYHEEHAAWERRND